jgi:hypothetical protein
MQRKKANNTIQKKIHLYIQISKKINLPNIPLSYLLILHALPYPIAWP